MRVILFLVVCAALAGAAPQPASAQSPTATLSGTVIDESGGLVPGVTVAVRNADIGLRREAVTDQQGTFTFPMLQPAHYVLSATLQGFAPIEVPDVVLNANDQQTLTVKLRVAAIGENVIVTARRRDESQQEVPLSLVARSGEDLLKARVNDLSQLERLVPGLIYGGLSVTATPTIMVRGVGSLATGAGVDASVGIAIDGAVTPQSSALASNFNDIEHIEVLRGPQGTLFGRNTSAGLISVATKDPSDRWTGTVDLGTGTYDDVALKAMVSGPIVRDKLLVRLALYSDRRDGYLYNVGKGRKVMDDRQTGARATLLYRPAPATRLRLRLFDVVRRNDWAHSVMPARSVGPLSNPIDRQVLGQFAGPENSQIWTTGDGSIDYLTKTWGSTLQWDQQIGDYALTSITSYLDWHWRQYWNGLTDGPAPYTLRAVNDAFSWNNQWSQEVRMASPADRRIDYVAGFYFYHLLFGGSNEHRFVPAAGALQFNSSEGSVTTNSAAPFGEANLHVTRSVTLTAGARWTHEEKDYYVLGRQAPPDAIPFLLSTFPGELRDRATVGIWSWRLGTRWKPSERQMIYVTAARGFKGAGFNAITTTGTSQKVRPEVATTYEVGSKVTWLDGRLAANLAFYYSLFIDAQANAFAITTSSTGGGTPVTFALTNAGKLRSQGAEFELTAAPGRNFTINLTGAFVDAIFKEFRNGQCYAGQTAAQGCVGTPASQDLSGTRLPLAPRLSWTLSADYDAPLARLPANGFLRANYSWRDDVQYSYANAPDSIEPAYGLLGASAGVRSRDGRYTLSVWGKNLTNKFHVGGLGILSPGGLGTVTQQIGPDYRRMLGVTFNVAF